MIPQVNNGQRRAVSHSTVTGPELPQGELVTTEFQVGEDIASGHACELLFRLHVWDFARQYLREAQRPITR